MTHSATPVSAPKVTSGNTRSVDWSNRYPIKETAQHEPTTHSAIEVELGIPVIARPFSGAGWKEIAPTDASAPGRSHQPCGGCRGTPSPSTLVAMLRRSKHRSRPCQPVLRHMRTVQGPGPTATFFLSTPGGASAQFHPPRGRGGYVRRMGAGSCRRHKMSHRMLEFSDVPGRCPRICNGAGQQFGTAPAAKRLKITRRG
jgi:hypothetical protein